MAGGGSGVLTVIVLYEAHSPSSHDGKMAVHRSIALPSCSSVNVQTSSSSLLLEFLSRPLLEVHGTGVATCGSFGCSAPGSAVLVRSGRRNLARGLRTFGSEEATTTQPQQRKRKQSKKNNGKICLSSLVVLSQGTHPVNSSHVMTRSPLMSSFRNRV